MQYREIIELLKSLSNPKAAEGMARFGINPKGTLGVSIPSLRKIAKTVGKDQRMASQLWKSGIHEARLLAGFIDDPTLVTPDQMEKCPAGRAAGKLLQTVTNGSLSIMIADHKEDTLEHISSFKKKEGRNPGADTQ